MITLYHWEPNGLYLKPLIALHEKAAKFESRYFDALKFEQFAPDFPANVEAGLHLEREGPVLVDGDEVISSSYFMLEYIAEAAPGVDLLPGDSFEHYRQRAFGQFLALQLGPSVSQLGAAKYLAPALKTLDRKSLKARIAEIEPQERRLAWLAVVEGAYDAEQIARIKEALQFPIGRVEGALENGPWLAGDAYSIADIDAYALLKPLPDLAPEVVNAKATPKIAAFLKRMAERPAVKAALAASKSGRPETAFVPGPEPSRWG